MSCNEKKKQLFLILSNLLILIPGFGFGGFYYTLTKYWLNKLENTCLNKYVHDKGKQMFWKILTYFKKCIVLLPAKRSLNRSDLKYHYLYFGLIVPLLLWQYSIKPLHNYTTTEAGQLDIFPQGNRKNSFCWGYTKLSSNCLKSYQKVDEQTK